MLKRFYARVMTLAASPYATWWLAAIAFAEASFFPIPPDALLGPMIRRFRVVFVVPSDRSSSFQ